jgi:hypothetical protein
MPRTSRRAAAAPARLMQGGSPTPTGRARSDFRSWAPASSMGRASMPARPIGQAANDNSTYSDAALQEYIAKQRISASDRRRRAGPAGQDERADRSREYQAGVRRRPVRRTAEVFPNSDGTMRKFVTSAGGSVRCSGPGDGAGSPGPGGHDRARQSVEQAARNLRRLSGQPVGRIARRRRRRGAARDRTGDHQRRPGRPEAARRPGKGSGSDLRSGPDQIVGDRGFEIQRREAAKITPASNATSPTS